MAGELAYTSLADLPLCAHVVTSATEAGIVGYVNAYAVAVRETQLASEPTDSIGALEPWLTGVVTGPAMLAI